MKNSMLLVTLVAIVTLVSCENKITRELNHLEAMIDVSPDSALTLLTALPRNSILTERERARYSLLLSIAQDKNYIDTMNDSIIHIAVDYYATRRLSPYRMKSWYYEGVVQYNAGDYTSAIVSLEKSERDALLLNDNYYLGLINRKKASIYNSWINMPASIECQEKAMSAFLNAGKYEHADYSKLALGIELSNYKQYDKAREIIQEVRGNTDNPLLIQLCDLRLASIMINKNESPQEALNIFERTPDTLFDLYDYGFYALAFERAGKPDSASIWMDKGYSKACNKADSASLDYVYSRIALLRKDYRRALSYLDNAAQVQEINTQSILQESLNSALKDYYQQELISEEEQSAREKERILLMGVILGLVAIMLAGGLVLRLKRKDQLLELQISRYAAVQQENRGIKQENAYLLGSLFSERIHHLDEMSKEYFNANDEEKKEMLFGLYKQYINKFRNDKEAFKSLEEDLDKYENGIMQKLKEQVPSINSEKRKIVALFFVGLSYETIQLITNSMSTGSLRTLKTRIRNEIKNSNAPDKDFFLSMLDTKQNNPRF